MGYFEESDSESEQTLGGFQGTASLQATSVQGTSVHGTAHGTAPAHGAARPAPSVHRRRRGDDVSTLEPRPRCRAPVASPRGTAFGAVAFPATTAVLWDRGVRERWFVGAAERVPRVVVTEAFIARLRHAASPVAARLVRESELARLIDLSGAPPTNRGYISGPFCLILSADDGRDAAVAAETVFVDVLEAASHAAHTQRLAGCETYAAAAACFGGDASRAFRLRVLWRNESESSVRLRLEAVVPRATLCFAALAVPLPLLPTPLEAELRATRARRRAPPGRAALESGFLTLDAARRAVLLLRDDPLARSAPLVGVWVGGLAVRDLAEAVRHPRVVDACATFLFDDAQRRVHLVSQRTCLAAVFSSEFRADGDGATVKFLEVSTVDADGDAFDTLDYTADVELCRAGSASTTATLLARLRTTTPPVPAPVRRADDARMLGHAGLGDAAPHAPRAALVRAPPLYEPWADASSNDWRGPRPSRATEASLQPHDESRATLQPHGESRATGESFEEPWAIDAAAQTDGAASDGSAASQGASARAAASQTDPHDDAAATQLGEALRALASATARIAALELDVEALRGRSGNEKRETAAAGDGDGDGADDASDDGLLLAAAGHVARHGERGGGESNAPLDARSEAPLEAPLAARSDARSDAPAAAPLDDDSFAGAARPQRMRLAAPWGDDAAPGAAAHAGHALLAGHAFANELSCDFPRIAGGHYLSAARGNAEDDDDDDDEIIRRYLGDAAVNKLLATDPGAPAARGALALGASA
ncbi:hypothetical protein M885DRAFT_532939 [Pelagophyceae sp. CCMP2097]|nr:hypothetical protein M885DRAFT_532939 [Pelagophyceae sp. CCMP2097]